jgi:hypothetical protein
MHARYDTPVTAGDGASADAEAVVKAMPTRRRPA